MRLAELQQYPEFVGEGPTFRHLASGKFHNRDDVYADALAGGGDAAQVSGMGAARGKTHPYLIAFRHQHFDFVVTIGNCGIEIERVATRFRVVAQMLEAVAQMTVSRSAAILGARGTRWR